MRQLTHLGIPQIPSQGGAGGLVVGLGLLDKGVHVEFLREGRGAPRELHQRGDDDLVVLGHDQGGAVARELGRSQPPQEGLLDAGGDHGQERDGPQRKQVGRGQPNAVVALEVPQLVRQDALNFGGAERVDEGGVHDDEGLPAGDGQGVGVRLRVLPNVELRDVHLQDARGLAQELVDVGELLLADQHRRADVLQQRDLLRHGAQHGLDDALDTRQERDELRVLAVERVAQVVGLEVRDVPHLPLPEGLEDARGGAVVGGEGGRGGGGGGRAPPLLRQGARPGGGEPRLARPETQQPPLLLRTPRVRAEPPKAPPNALLPSRGEPAASAPPAAAHRLPHR
mmetsp:Transcript_10107/g.25247  ORF Transcript_10107/g.25247 Transcript_10107/m.25247 type:complete len:340 (-) Transcript_10107:500-1519(-)